MLQDYTLESNKYRSTNVREQIDIDSQQSLFTRTQRLALSCVMYRSVLIQVEILFNYLFNYFEKVSQRITIFILTSLDTKIL